MHPARVEGGTEMEMGDGHVAAKETGRTIEGETPMENVSCFTNAEEYASQMLAWLERESALTPTSGMVTWMAVTLRQLAPEGATGHAVEKGGMEGTYPHDGGARTGLGEGEGVGVLVALGDAEKLPVQL